ncbi:MAG: ParB N-terminal domain-containing protein [Spirochaetes bacterium]|nr:ParB N-terminal domain-containing protein [Spirochaetota bacterium]
MKVRIEEIKIKKRIRKEIGDISDLMESISKFGLMNPVTVTEDMELVAGFRRLQACKALGMEEIECRMVPTGSRIDRLLMEADENLARKELTFNEVQHYEEERQYLLAGGFEKVRLWLLRLFRTIVDWVKKFILRRDD